MHSRWYNMTQDNDELHDIIAVPTSCCPTDDGTSLLHRRCQQTAARLQLDVAYDTAQNRHFHTTHRNHTFHLQVGLLIFILFPIVIFLHSTSLQCT